MNAATTLHDFDGHRIFLCHDHSVVQIAPSSTKPTIIIILMSGVDCENYWWWRVIRIMDWRGAIMIMGKLLVIKNEHRSSLPKKRTSHWWQIVVAIWWYLAADLFNIQETRLISRTLASIFSRRSTSYFTQLQYSTYVLEIVVKLNHLVVFIVMEHFF